MRPWPLAPPGRLWRCQPGPARIDAVGPASRSKGHLGRRTAALSGFAIGLLLGWPTVSSDDAVGGDSSPPPHATAPTHAPDSATVADAPPPSDALPVEALIERLTSPRYDERQDAAWSLIERGPDVVEPLLESLTGRDRERLVRAREVVTAVALAGDADAESVLTELDRMAGDVTRPARQRFARLTRDAIERTVEERAVARLTELGAKIQTDVRFVTGLPGAGTVATITIDRSFRGTSDDLLRLRKIRYVFLADLEGDVITDDVIAALQPGVLRQLTLKQTAITDNVLPSLTAMTSLNSLMIYYAGLTDAAIEPLRTHPSLTNLELWSGSISLEAGQKLRENFGGRIDFRRGGFLGIKGPPTGDQCVVSSAEPGTSAEKAGLQSGDVITAFNDYPVGSFQDLVKLISDYADGEKATFILDREGEELTRTITLGRRETWD